MTYYVKVRLEMDDYVEANSPEEAFLILSEDAMSGGLWEWTADAVDDDGNPVEVDK